jgi:hemerythrin
MAQIKWNKADACFLPEIDAEHRSIYRLADELRQALAAQPDPAKADAILRNLLASAEDHLAHEERLMRSMRYPSLAWHKKQHDTLRHRALTLAPALDESNLPAVQDFLQFLTGWMRDHVGLTDRMLGAYVRNYERSHARVAS